MKKRISTVHEESGVTRDRVSMLTQWQDKPFLLMDTGGLGIQQAEEKSRNVWWSIFDQLMFRLKMPTWLSRHRHYCRCDWNGSRGLCISRSKERRWSSPVIKRQPDLENSVGLFSSLGWRTSPISCFRQAQYFWFTDVAKNIPQVEGDSLEDPDLKIAVAGRPNAGNSSIINRLSVTIA